MRHYGSQHLAEKGGVIAMLTGLLVLYTAASGAPVTLRSFAWAGVVASVSTALAFAFAKGGGDPA